MAVLPGQLSIFLRQLVTIQKLIYSQISSLKEKKPQKYKGEKCVKL